MGGNAIKPLGSGVAGVRVTRDEMNAISAAIQARVPFECVVPRVLPDKTTFGDLDILCDRATVSNDELNTRIGATGFVKNGSVTSFAVPFGPSGSLFQVDFIHMATPHIPFAEAYFSYGGTGNLLGTLSRYYGLRLSDRGLFLPVDPGGNNQISYVPLSTDFPAILSFLGYDPKRFDTDITDLRSFLDYLGSSPLVTPEVFNPEHFSHRDRTRDRRRDMVSSFFRYVKDLPERRSPIPYGHYKTPEGKAALFAHFPSAVSRFESLMEENARKDQIRGRFNGTLVSRITGLEKQDLGAFMADYRSLFPSQDALESFLLSTSPESIRLHILATHAFRQVPEFLTAYLVGGSVREVLKDRAPKDLDFVVTGETPESMVSRGFTPVGHDYPVFLHPETGSEFALARREVSTGSSHTDFSMDTSGVTLTEDLFRRDLTVNAMAVTHKGTLLDPYQGLNDLRNNVLREVSGHFAEDPLRILRVARFVSTLDPDATVTVSPSLRTLVTGMVDRGALETLSRERILGELTRCLLSPVPSRALEFLQEVGALARVLPEVSRLAGVPQDPKYHPEGDAFVHTMRVVDRARCLSADPRILFSALVHDVGKGVTPQEILPAHHDHENAGIPLVITLCDRLGVPAAWQRVALVTTEQHLRIHRAEQLTPAKVHDLLTTMGALHEGTLPVFEAVLTVCTADAYGKTEEKTAEETPVYPPGEFLRGAAEVAREIGGTQVRERCGETVMGPEFGRRLREMRISGIRKYATQRGRER